MSEAASLVPVAIDSDTFGGLISALEMPAENVPNGASPDCQDVIFRENGVETRPGIVSQAALLAANNPTINYLKTFTDLSGNNWLLYLDSLGNMRAEFPQGTVTTLATTLVQGARAKSTTLFGREYQAIHDGKFGLDMPRQFDGVNFDRVTQGGPGAAPTVADAAAEGTFTIAASPNGAVRANNIVTITTTAAHGYQVGQQVNIAGVTDTSFNANGFTILTVPSTTTFTYAQQAAPSSSGAGTTTLAPQVVAGTHGVAVCFITRQGAFTKPSPTGTYSALGGRRAVVSGIPTGPSNIVGRMLMFTLASGSSYFSIQSSTNQPAATMVIMDNTTTTVTLDFSDSTLSGGLSTDYLFRLVYLGEASGVIDYANRLAWWGERTKLSNVVNFDFCGGFTAGLPHFPLGWTQDPTFAAGGAQASVQGDPISWGDAYSIVGNGATATRGKITQTMYLDPLGVAIISPNTAYSIRAKVARNAALVAGTFHINLSSVSGAFTTTGLQVTAAQAGLAYAEFTATLLPANQITGQVPSDLVLQVYADGTPTNNGDFVLGQIEIYPTASPTNLSLVRFSRNTAAQGPEPESYDGVNEILQVYKQDGQRVTAAFRIREKLYFCKERAMYVTQDTGDAVSGWSITQVSSRVGTPSVQGVGLGEDWAVIAARDGLYIFWGAEPAKISKEIQPLWNQINWSYAHTIWVEVDTLLRRIYIGAPMGAATTPSKILTLDYRGLDTAEDIAAHASIHFSAYTGKVLALGNARKWCPWTITANSGAMVERADGTKRFFLGNGAGNGKVYQFSDVLAQSDSVTYSDDGAAIPSYYQTYFFPAKIEEQQYQLGAHRKLFGYLTSRVEGLGTLNITAIAAGSVFTFNLATWALYSPALQDFEQTLNLSWERMSFKFSTNVAGSWFRILKAAVSMSKHPFSELRGTAS